MVDDKIGKIKACISEGTIDDLLRHDVALRVTPFNCLVAIPIKSGDYLVYVKNLDKPMYDFWFKASEDICYKEKKNY